jgi:hypothetical protein
MILKCHGARPRTTGRQRLPRDRGPFRCGPRPQPPRQVAQLPLRRLLRRRRVDREGPQTLPAGGEEAGGAAGALGAGGPQGPRHPAPLHHAAPQEACRSGRRRRAAGGHCSPGGCDGGVSVRALGSACRQSL